MMQVVIAASIVFFQTAANGANIAGTALALSGVLLYSIAKRSKPAEPVDVDKVRPPPYQGSIVDLVFTLTTHHELCSSRSWFGCM